MLDEIRPSQPRGGRAAMTADELKKLCSINIQATIDARHRDIMLAVNQPRIVTANSMNPSEWYRDLPPDLYTTSAGTRLLLPPDVKAIGKRISWAFVGESVISQEMRDAYSRRA